MKIVLYTYILVALLVYLSFPYFVHAITVVDNQIFASNRASNDLCWLSSPKLHYNFQTRAGIIADRSRQRRKVSLMKARVSRVEEDD